MEIKRCYDTIIGASVGENQIFDPSRVEYGAFPFTKNGIEFTLSAEGRIILNGTATTDTSALGFAKILSGHKYYRKNLRSNAFNTFLYYPLDDESVVNATGDNEYAAINIQNGTTVTNYEYGGMIIDLTAELGSSIADYIYSLETATAGSGIAKLRSWGFLRGYQAFNAGSIESVEVTGKKVRGFNAWDEESQIGFWKANGTFSTNQSGYMSSKNAIKVMPNTNYYITIGGTGHTSYYILYLDADGNPIKRDTYTYATKREFTTPQNAYYIQFSTEAFYGTAYNNDICINLSSPRNGEYEPYTEQIYDYGTDTLNGIFKLDANNNLYAHGDVKTSDGFIARKYSIVDLGTLNWTKVAISGGELKRFSAPLPDAKPTASGGIGVANAISTRYEIITPNKTFLANADGFAIHYSSPTSVLAYIADYSDVDASAFKTAMSGVYLAYEKVTETTEQSTPFTSPQVCYPDGTEEYITSNGVPVGHETRYEL